MVFGFQLCVLFSDGCELIGCGIGLVLEVYDVFVVLQNYVDVLVDLCVCVLQIVVVVLEIGGLVGLVQVLMMVIECLDFGCVWVQFQVICIVQGGLCVFGSVLWQQLVLVLCDGVVMVIDNWCLLCVVKLVGVFFVLLVGFILQVYGCDCVSIGQLLFIVYV